MANITHEQLIEYDSKLKSYINNIINSKTVYYEQRIQELLNTINDLRDTITDLEKNGVNNTDVIDNVNTDIDNNDIIDTPIIPMLRSVPIVRSIKPEEPIVVQEDIEEDYIVYDRIIYPNENKQYKNIVVTTDDRSNRIWFSMWKTFDDRPLSEGKQISVIWINAEGHKGESICGDIQILPDNDGDRLYFSWDIPDRCTVKAGIIRFAIRITNLDGFPEYAWHTLPTEIECMQGLMDGDWEDTPDAQASVDWADYIEDKWAQILVILTRDEYDDIAEKEEIVYVVKEEDDSVTMYLGETEITTGGGGGGSNTFDIRFDANSQQLQKTYDGTNWENVVLISSGGNISNIVSLTSQQYSNLQEIDPETLYLLKD